MTISTAEKVILRVAVVLVVASAALTLTRLNREDKESKLRHQAVYMESLQLAAPVKR